MLRKAFGMMLRIAIVVGLAILLHDLAGWAMRKGTDLASSGSLDMSLVAALLLLYAALLAIPFVPGIELGVALMLIEGSAAAPWVWLATVLGLTLAYGAGTCLPPQRLSDLLRGLRLIRAADLIDRIAPLPAPARLFWLKARLPDWLGARALSHRYLLLAALINLPGNALVGGGGGIGLVAGLSRIYAPLPTIFTFALAVSPAPVLFWFYGDPVLSWVR